MRTGEAGTRASKSRLDPRDLIRHWWPILLGLIGTATLAVAPAVPHAHFRVGRTDYAWTSHLVFVGVLCTVFSGIEFGRRQLRLDRLRDEKTTFEANARAGALALARLIFHELDSIRRSAGHYSNERVSLFRSEGDHFVLVGRRSASPVWELTSGRETYPLSEGFLGTAWQDGRAEEGGLPSAGPGRPWDEAWVAAQSAHGIPEHTARSLEMPSRAYLALRIETPLKPLGVLVFESVNSVHEAEQSGAGASLDFDRLTNLQRQASARLALLLAESAFVDAATLRELRPDVPG
jgi:hypothetical protein